jgi:FkbM family methyltransferase
VPLLDEGAIGTFWLEFPDLVLPYILEKRNRQYDFASVDVLITEGPYELKKEVSVAGGDVVVDCGANLGLFSAVAGRKAKKVYAFEPDPQIIENYLSQTIRLNKTDATICPYALGRKAGTCSFERAPKDNLGSGKVTGVEKENTFPVEIVTLDQFVEDNGIEKIDFIKADIEGAERDMLRGATRVLKEMAPKLSICTYHLPDDKEVLEGIVLKANPQYKIEHHYQKLYAYVPKN